MQRKHFLAEACRSARSIDGSLILREPNPARSEAPLTHAQERLWLLDRFHPGDFAYNIPEVFEITTPLEPALLQQAIDHLVRRHETLRTRIVETPEKVLQQSCTDLQLPLEVIDLQTIPPAGRRDRLDQLLKEASRRPFHLATAPLARFHLYIVEAGRHVLLINLHHIIADRWSINILYRELLSAYLACLRGEEPMLPPLPIQYSDYAIWERSIAVPRMQQQLQYWQQQLSALPEPLALPFSRSIPLAAAAEGAVLKLQLSRADTQQLRAFAKLHGASLYMVLLAAYSALLHRYTGAEDVCIGTPVSERSFRETEPLIGLFVNTLVMRCRIAPDSSFVELLAAARNTVLDAHAHRDVPFQKILNCVAGGEADLRPNAASPLFQTMLAFDPLPPDATSSGNNMIELDPGFAKFDLTLQLKEDPDQIHGWFEYRTDIASSDAIQQFATAFVQLLSGMLASPATPIGEVDILPDHERQLLLETWNDTAMPFPKDKTIHRLFEEQASATPHQVAIIDGHRRITYAQLNSASDQIADLLLGAGIQLEAIIGVHLPRTAEMIAAMLGILKAGAAYLPLDPKYPAVRIDAMLAGSGCAIVLTDVVPVEWSFPRARPLGLPVLFNPWEARLPRLPVAPSNLAYVIYTSGSTGNSKAVAIEHHSSVSFLSWAKNTFASDVLRGTLAATSISFDLSVFEIFLPLTTGHTVILAADIFELPLLPALGEVTLATMVPSAAAAMLEAGSFPPTLRHLNLAGELLPASLVDRLYAETRLEKVHDLYGPTETTTYSTCALRQPGEPPTIGRPIANTRLYLLDSRLRPVPIGMTGELFIAGEGVARGYLNLPALTHERFLPLPHLGEQGLTYRTGDLCQYNLNGTLVYRGRKDDQVKVNGFRIEPAEIEAVLRAHPAIDDACVLTQVHNGGASLVAAIRSSQPLPDHAALIEHQASQLPPHMVVRRFVPVETFPLTANGKTDRRRLAQQVEESQAARLQQGTRRPQPPTNDTEHRILKIWKESFLDDAIGIDDDFFQLGGHSLLALRIFADIELRLGRRLMLSLLFQAPTVRLLARHL